MSTRTLPAETAAPPRSRDVGALELLRFLAGPLRYLEGLRDGRDVVPFRLGGERAHLVLDPELAANDEPALEAPAEIAVARIRRRAEGWVEGQPLELYGELRALCGAIAWEALTGTDLDAAPGMLEAVEVRPLGPPWPPGRRDARKLDSVLGLMIAERRERDAGDLLSEAVRKGGDVRARVKSWLTADRLHAHLTWTLHLLGRHPGVEGRWHEELDAVLGARAATAADVPALGYTAKVLEESARIYPPAWATARRVTEDERVGGHVVPAGHLLVHSPWVTGRDPRRWPEPLRFDVDRAGRAPAPRPAVIALATLGQRWAFRAAGPAPRPSAGWATEPHPGARMKPVPRP